MERMQDLRDAKRARLVAQNISGSSAGSQFRESNEPKEGPRLFPGSPTASSWWISCRPESPLKEVARAMTDPGLERILAPPGTP